MCSYLNFDFFFLVMIVKVFFSLKEEHSSKTHQNTEIHDWKNCVIAININAYYELRI